MAKSLLDLVFPIQCLGCSSYNTWACQHCLRANIRPFSQRSTQPYINTITALGWYKNRLLSRLIQQMKFHGSKQIADGFAQLLPYWIDASAYDVVIPVPLHRRRKRSRGYNQAELLASTFRQTNPSLVARSRFTKQQALLNRKQRLQNLDNAFKLSNQASKKQSVEGLRCLVVDDVYTTGSTINAVAEVLIQHGAIQVDAIVVAVD